MNSLGLRFLSTAGKWRAYRRCCPNLSIVFLDVVLMLLLGNVQYWATWLVNHVFFSALNHVVPTSPGWDVGLKVFDHWNLSGFTTSPWKLGVW